MGEERVGEIGRGGIEATNIAKHLRLSPTSVGHYAEVLIIKQASSVGPQAE